MIVDCARYLDGHRLPGKVELDELTPGCYGGEGFIWLGLRGPARDELEAAKKAFGLHEVAVEDATETQHERPKLEFYDDHLFLVVRTSRYDEETSEVHFGEIAVFCGLDFIVVVRHGQASPLSRARAEFERRPDLMTLGPSAVLHAIVDQVVDDYLPVLHGVDEDLEELEEAVFDQSRQVVAPRLYELKKEVIDFRRAAEPLLDPLRTLASQRTPLVHPDIRPFFTDVRDNLARTVDRIADQRDLLSSVLDANLTQVAIRQNEDMRKISSWVAIAAVPTMIAGIYGMNFTHFPELEWSFGYPLVLAVMATACLLLYRAFRRNDWL